jgi:hypothetical protein
VANCDSVTATVMNTWRIPTQNLWRELVRGKCGGSPIGVSVAKFVHSSIVQLLFGSTLGKHMSQLTNELFIASLSIDDRRRKSPLAILAHCTSCILPICNYCIANCTRAALQSTLYRRSICHTATSFLFLYPPFFFCALNLGTWRDGYESLGQHE